jgi:hypothetical protein
MKKPMPEKPVVKKNIFRRFLNFLKGRWNSMLYWLMFKKYNNNCCGIKDCDCNKNK